MSDQKPNLDSLFEAAVEINSLAERTAFLDQSCGDNIELREQVDQLLVSYGQAERFLEQPAADLDATFLTDASGKDLAASLEAGLAPAFGENAAVAIVHASHSVLAALGQTVDAPRIVLRESRAEGDDPITRPSSPEMPDRDSESRYQLQGEIARGGMGAILKGRDTDLGRDLAIKVLLDSHKDKPEVIQRFVEEAQIGGQLQHPGIAPIYELGQFSDRRPFFAMKLVKGETLSKLLKEREDLATDRGKFIGIFEQMCQTMAYAHSRGVIHRDLKPANIMVGAFGEVQVMDWGLAKVLSTGGVADEKKAHDQQLGQSIIQTLRSGVGSDGPAAFGSVGSETQIGSVMGTPAYMPPEQALGEIDNMDERADVFGLGAILCEILSGKPPYVADDGTRVFRMAARGNLHACFERLDVSGTDPDLIAIAKHCLELEPADRPRDAGVLAERVTAYLESVETKLRKSEIQRAAETARAIEQRKRHRVTLALATLVLLMVCFGGGGWYYLERQAAARLATAKQRVNEALGEARLHAGLADRINRGTEQGLAEWALELERAHRSAAEAKQIAERERITPESLASVTALELELAEYSANAQRLANRAAANRALLDELELIKLGEASGAAGDEHSQPSELPSSGSEGTSRKYERAFQKAGLDLKNSTVEEIVAWIDQSEVREEVIAELDNWRRLYPLSRFAFDASLEARNWYAAVHIARLGVQQQQKNAEYWLGLGIMLAMTENESDLRQHALSMVSSFRDSGVNDDFLRTIDTCLLLPAVVNPAELPDKWLESHWNEINVTSDAWELRSRALFAYRRGDPETALDCIRREESLNTSHASSVIMSLSVKALALHQLQRTEEARTCLEKAARVLRGLTARQRSNVDILHAMLFVREAQIAVYGQSDPQLAAELAPSVGPAQNEAEMLGKLLVVIDAADSTPWRKRIRAALIAEDTELLVELALADETASQSAALSAWLGATLREVGEQDISILVLQNSQQQHPGDFWLNFELGQSLTRTGKTLEGLGYMRAAVAIRPESPAALMGVVQILDDGKERDAIFRRVLAMDSRNAETQFRIGEFLVDQGRLGEGIAAYRNAVAIDPNSSEYYFRLGQALKANGDQKAAVAEFTKSVTLQQLGADFYNRLGEVLRQQGALEDAVAALRSAVERDSENSWTLYQLGDALNQKGDWEEAISTIRSAMRIEPQHAGFKHGALVRIWETTDGGLPAVIAERRREIENDPDNDWLYFELGLLLQTTGNLKEAFEVIRKAIELDSELPWNHLALGNCLLRQRDLDEAVAEFRKSIELDPGYAAAHRQLGRTLQQQRKLVDAIDAFRNAVSFHPHDRGYRYELGRALQANGDLDEAIDVFRRAASDFPDTGWIHYELGLVLKMDGDLHGAIVEFKKMLAVEPKFAQQNPGDTNRWLRMAPILVFTGDETAYTEYCKWIAGQPVDNVMMAERVIKVCLLRAESIDLAALPIEELTTSLDAGSFPKAHMSWAWSTRALLAYRRGDTRSAAEFAASCESSGPPALCSAMNLSILAMVHDRLGESAPARAALGQASELIKESQKEKNNRTHHDLLIAELLRREAEAMINGTAGSTETNTTPSAKSVETPAEEQTGPNPAESNDRNGL